MKKIKAFDVVNYVFFAIITFLSIFPIYLIAANAFSAEADILNHGYTAFPLNFTVKAFAYILQAPQQLLTSTFGTLVYALGGGFVAVVVQAMMGFVLTRPEYCLKKFAKIVLTITMFFGAGLIPSYIVNTQVFHLEDSWLVYIFPGCVSGFTVFVYRTFFNQIPHSLVESAEIDGASPFRVFTSIVLPISKPILATQYFLTISGRWRDFTTTLYYISDPNKYTLEFYIQRLLSDARLMTQNLIQLGIDSSTIPTETMRFATVFFALIPMLVIFPFFQKQLSKGAVVGAVKG